MKKTQNPNDFEKRLKIFTGKRMYPGKRGGENSPQNQMEEV
jgi:hypothetical protein